MPDRTTLHLTVAAVVQYQGRFLFVEEIDKQSGKRVLNQPAGHVEANEDLRQAIERELFEETGLQLQPCGWLGISQLLIPNGHRYVRINFVFEPIELPDTYAPQDPDILALHWLTAEELSRMHLPVRSQLVHAAVEHYRCRTIFPLVAIDDVVLLS